MDWIEILISVCAAALVVFTVVFNAVRKKKGKSPCGCDCSARNGGACGGCPKGLEKESNDGEISAELNGGEKTVSSVLL